mmetsp:Transcript_34271/g.73986  ORF Transcript_34271/g.73986 Transcript_34271/m.73986 type:complete len:808 (-) Transcript_34271:301-2724(-)
MDDADSKDHQRHTFGTGRLAGTGPSEFGATVNDSFGEILVPTVFKPMTVDEQIVDACRRLEEGRDVFQDLDAPYQMKPYKALSSSLNSTAAREGQRVMSVLADPRFQVIREYRKKIDADEEFPQIPEASRLWMFKWREEFRLLYKNLQEIINCSPTAAIMEEQLRGTYEWYRMAAAAMGEANTAVGGHNARSKGRSDPNDGPHFYELVPEELASDSYLPGSAFFGLQEEIHEELESGSQTFSQLPAVLPGANDSSFPRQPPVAQLPTAKERLQYIRTKQVATPTNFKIPTIAAMPESRTACPSPSRSPDLDRPFTPSTVVGGSTVRTASSARSTPSPFPIPSRPASAARGYRRPLTASSARGPEVVNSRRVISAGLPARPGTSMGLTTNSSAIPEEKPQLSTEKPSRPHVTISPNPTPQSTTTIKPKVVAAPVLTPSLAPVQPWKIPKDPPTEAELRMEERWLQCRHRAVADKRAAEARQRVLREWSERRARVEEEIARNCEISRYQSELRRRGYRMPDDADEDIEASPVRGSRYVSTLPKALSKEGRSASEAAPNLRSSQVADEEEGELEGDEEVAALAEARIQATRSAPAGPLVVAETRPPLPEAPVSDANAPNQKQSAVSFSPDGAAATSQNSAGAIQPAKPKMPISARAAYLRKLHKRLLDPPQDPVTVPIAFSAAPPPSQKTPAAETGGEDDDDEDDDEGASPDVDDEEEGDDDDDDDEDGASGNGGSNAGSEEAPNDTPDPDLVNDLQNDEASPMGNLFATEDGAGFLSLSPYTFDRDEEPSAVGGGGEGGGGGGAMHGES